MARLVSRMNPHGRGAALPDHQSKSPARPSSIAIPPFQRPRTRNEGFDVSQACGRCPTGRALLTEVSVAQAEARLGWHFLTCTSNSWESATTVCSFPIAVSAAFALEAGLWFRRGRLVMVSQFLPSKPNPGRNPNLPGCAGSPQPYQFTAVGSPGLDHSPSPAPH